MVDQYFQNKILGSPPVSLSVFSHPPNKLGGAAHDSFLWCSPLLSIAEISSATKLSSFCCSFLHSLAFKDVFRLLQDGPRSFWVFLPLTHPLPPCPAARHCSARRRECWLLWMLSNHTGAIQRKPGHRNPSLHHSRDAESQTQSREP